VTEDDPFEPFEVPDFVEPLQAWRVWRVAPPAVARVLGLVSLWGTVVECERGYRASHAYPLHLYVPIDAAWQKKHCWDELVSGLESYDVPVEPLAARCSETVWVLEQRRQLAARERRA
jgi:hypothetical protein